jgi:Double zinc ribbon
VDPVGPASAPTHCAAPRSRVMNVAVPGGTCRCGRLCALGRPLSTPSLTGPVAGANLAHLSATSRFGWRHGMQCPRCQHEAQSDAEYCPECGAKPTVVCARCSTANAPSHRFCKKCQQSFTTLQAPGHKRFLSPEASTHQHPAEKILTSKSAVEGERKQVTVLFADLKGSMELPADRDPDEARKLIDPVLEHSPNIRSRRSACTSPARSPPSETDQRPPRASGRDRGRPR